MQDSTEIRDGEISVACKNLIRNTGLPEEKNSMLHSTEIPDAEVTVTCTKH